MVDGHEVARVGNGKQVTVVLEPGRHTVYKAMDWARSEPLDIDARAEQSLQLECGCNVKPFRALVYAVARRWIWLRPAGDAVS